MQQILVVSDEPVFVHRLHHRLAAYDIEVLAAQNGEQALHALLDNSPELIVLSEHLPGLDATEVCRIIRAGGYTESRALSWSWPVCGHTAKITWFTRRFSPRMEGS